MMLNKFLVIGIVALVIVAGFLFMFPSAEGNDEIEATATIYVQSVNGGEIMEAEIDLSKLSMSEQMMMSITGEVRTMDFTGDISALSQVGLYNLWIVTKVKVTATDDIASLTKIVCQVSGRPGDTIYGSPNHETSTITSEKLWTIGGSASATIEKTSTVLGTEYTFDQSGVSNGKFASVYDSATKATGSLNGNRIDGTLVTALIAAYAVDDSGTTVRSEVSATLKISVNSWSQSGLSIAITGMSAGTAAV